MADIRDCGRAEDRLSEERFRSALRAVNGIVWTTNAAGEMEGEQPGWAALTGQSYQEYQGDGWSFALHPDDARPTLDTWKRAMARREPIDFEHRLRRDDGEWRQFTVRAVPVLRDDGEVAEWVGVHTDVTDQRQAEARLRESGGDFRALAENIPQLAWMADATGWIFWYNRRWYEYSGTTPEQMVGWGWRSLHDPETLPSVLKCWKASIAAGEPFDMVFPLKGADGIFRPFLTRSMPVRDADGKAVRWFGTNTDISELRGLEDSLRASEERVHLAVTAAGIGYWSRDLTTGRTRLDDRCADLFEVGNAPDATEVLGKILVEDRPATEAAIERAIEGIAPFRSEFRIRLRDGSIRWLVGLGSVVRDDAGRPVQMAGVHFDVTDRKRIEEEKEQLLKAAESARVEAEAANRMKDEFLATLSHELRTPLNAIIGWTRILRTGTIADEDRAEGLEVIDRNARAQAQLIEDLLDVSRIISGKLALDVRRVDLPEVIEEAMNAIMPAALAKEIRVQVVLDSLARPVSGDPTRLQQVVWNLLANAVKFTPRGGRVQVLLDRVDSHVEISVVDTGIGIRPEFLPFVFDRFRQADSTTTRQHGGLGLGLAIVRQLTELHGGSVRVKSPGEGEGTTFIVALPITIVHPEQPDQTGPRPNEPDECRDPRNGNGLKGVRVLVVDDEPDARNLMKRILNECGAQVEAAGSVREALAAVEEFRPDVLVSDIGMPEQDGYDLIRAVRKRHSARQLPAAALTAFARSEDRSRSMRAGFQMHVSKPVNLDEFVAVVATLAGRTVGDA